MENHEIKNNEDLINVLTNLNEGQQLVLAIDDNETFVELKFINYRLNALRRLSQTVVYDLDGKFNGEAFNHVAESVSQETKKYDVYFVNSLKHLVGEHVYKLINALEYRWRYDFVNDVVSIFKPSVQNCDYSYENCD